MASSGSWGRGSERPGRHDPRVRMVETVKDKPTKMQNYKYENKEDALAAKKKRDNRARRDRRRRAVDRLTAAQEEVESPSMRKRGWTKTMEECSAS